MRKLFIIFGLLLLITGCGVETEKSAEPEIVSTSIKLPSQEIQNFTLTETKNGRKKYTANAEYAAVYKDDNEVHTITLEVLFFGNNDSRSILTADSAYINEKTRSMKAIGHVVVISGDSTRLETDELTWDNKSEKIHTDKFVKVRRGRDVLTGIGIITDPHLRHLEIKKDMKAYVEDVDIKDF